MISRSRVCCPTRCILRRRPRRPIRCRKCIFRNAEAPYLYFDAGTYEVGPIGSRRFSSLAYDPSIFRILAPTRPTPAGSPLQEPGDEPGGHGGGARPTYHYVNRDSYQVIAPGFDGEYGIPIALTDNGTGENTPVFVVFPVMLPFHPVLAPDPNSQIVAPAIATFDKGHRDNITNFSDGKVLEDRIP